jgi:hypothetical protein
MGKGHKQGRPKSGDIVLRNEPKAQYFFQIILTIW